MNSDEVYPKGTRVKWYNPESGQWVFGIIEQVGFGRARKTIYTYAPDGVNQWESIRSATEIQRTHSAEEWESIIYDHFSKELAKGTIVDFSVREVGRINTTNGPLVYYLSDALAERLGPLFRKSSSKLGAVHLRVGGTTFLGEQGFSSIAAGVVSCPGLEALSLQINYCSSDTQISRERTDLVCQLIPLNKGLKKLAYSQFFMPDAAILSRLFDGSIEHLCLKDLPDASDERKNSLVQGLKRNVSIQHFALNDCAISTSVSCLSGLCGHVALQSLDLSFQTLDEAGAKVIGELLKQSVTLVDLRLPSRPKFRHGGYSYIAKGLRHNTSLLNLSVGIWKRRCEKPGLKAITSALEVGGKIQKLALDSFQSDYRTSVEQATILLPYLTRLPSLRCLDLRDCFFPENDTVLNSFWSGLEEHLALEEFRYSHGHRWRPSVAMEARIRNDCRANRCLRRLQENPDFILAKAGLLPEILAKCSSKPTTLYTVLQQHHQSFLCCKNSLQISTCNNTTITDDDPTSLPRIERLKIK